MGRMRNKMRQKRSQTEAAKRRRAAGGRQAKFDAPCQGHIDPLDRMLMSKKQLGKRRSNPHANISLSNKKRKKLLKAMAHQQRDRLIKKAEDPEDYETSILFGDADDQEAENQTVINPLAVDDDKVVELKTTINDNDAVMEEV